MATTPTTSTDRDYWLESGGILLLEYGGILCRLIREEAWRYRAPKKTPRDELLAEAHRLQTALVVFFEPRSCRRPPLKKYLMMEGAQSKHLSLPLASIAAIMSHKLLYGSDINIPMGALLGPLVETDPDKRSILEWRCIVATALALHPGLLRLSDEPDSEGFAVSVRLSPPFISNLLGLRNIPCLRPEYLLQNNEEVKTLTAGESGEAGSRNLKTTTLKDFVQSLPVMTPRELSEELEHKGYIGQTLAKKQVCLALYRHVLRLKKIHLENVPTAEVATVGNLLLRGDSGTGKSHMVKLLTQIVGLPSLIEDITKYSETGYVGEDCSTILSRAIVAAQGNVEIAQSSAVVCLDELDKISDAHIGNPLVSRSGVMRSLLTIIGGSVVVVPLDPNAHPFRGNRVKFDTGAGLIWFGIGAFSGWELMTGKRTTVGFGDGDRTSDIEQVAGSDAYSRYGFCSELLGRFTGGVVEFLPLSPDDMKVILLKNTLPRFEKECQVSGMTLRVEDSVLDLLVGEALERKTGARGLQASLESHLSEVMYSAYSDKGKCIRLVVSAGQIIGRVDSKEVEVSAAFTNAQ